MHTLHTKQTNTNKQQSAKKQNIKHKPYTIKKKQQSNNNNNQIYQQTLYIYYKHIGHTHTQQTHINTTPNPQNTKQTKQKHNKTQPNILHTIKHKHLKTNNNNTHIQQQQ